jgi:acetyl-CoA carboxylase biotin carboxyl carrier protein
MTDDPASADAGGPASPRAKVGPGAVDSGPIGARAVAAGPVGPGAVPADPPSPGDDASLLALIDRLATLLEQSELAELEVEVGGTGVVLRKPAAIAPPPAPAAAGGQASPHGGAGVPAAAAPPAGATRGVESAPAVPPAGAPAVRAPLTGIFYSAPAPGSAPYVRVGGEIAVGQVVGLIEAMKLFNEIKSDLAGRVVRVVAENGQLVKARQALIEVEPL